MITSLPLCTAQTKTGYPTLADKPIIDCPTSGESSPINSSVKSTFHEQRNLPLMLLGN